MNSLSSTDVERLIVKATGEKMQAEDWDTNLQLVDILNKRPDDFGTVMLRVILQRFRMRNANVQKLSLSLLEMLVKNTGPFFHRIVNGNDVINEISAAAQNRSRAFAPEVQRKAEEFLRDLRQQSSRSANQQSAQPSLSDSDKLHKDLAVVNENVVVLTEILNSVNSVQELQRNDIAREMHGTCKAMQNRLVTLIPQVDNESLLIELITTNDALVKVLEKYDEVLKGKITSSRAPQTNNRPQQQSKDLLSLDDLVGGSNAPPRLASNDDLDLQFDSLSLRHSQKSPNKQSQPTVSQRSQPSNQQQQVSSQDDDIFLSIANRKRNETGPLSQQENSSSSSKPQLQAPQKKPDDLFDQFFGNSSVQQQPPKPQQQQQQTQNTDLFDTLFAGTSAPQQQQQQPQQQMGNNPFVNVPQNVPVTNPYNNPFNNPNMGMPINNPYNNPYNTNMGMPMPMNMGMNNLQPQNPYMQQYNPVNPSQDFANFLNTQQTQQQQMPQQGTAPNMSNKQKQKFEKDSDDLFSL